jgi:hypothetical protein
MRWSRQALVWFTISTTTFLATGADSRCADGSTHVAETGDGSLNWRGVFEGAAREQTRSLTEAPPLRISDLQTASSGHGSYGFMIATRVEW